jgi:hypothetical protein
MNVNNHDTDVALVYKAYKTTKPSDIIVEPENLLKTEITGLVVIVILLLIAIHSSKKKK